MALLVAILVVAALLAGFLSLTATEQKRGTRLFKGAREALDTKTDTVVSYLTSTHEQTSLVKTIRTVLDHVVHDVAHGVLVAVRFVERTLTRVTREVRARRSQRNGGEPPVQ